MVEQIEVGKGGSKMNESSMLQDALTALLLAKIELGREIWVQDTDEIEKRKNVMKYVSISIDRIRTYFAERYSMEDHK